MKREVYMPCFFKTIIQKSGVLILLVLLNSACRNADSDNEAENRLLDFLLYAQNHEVVVKGDNDWELLVIPAASQEVTGKPEIPDAETFQAAGSEQQIALESVQLTKERFTINPNVQLMVDYNGQLVYLIIDVVNEQPVAISMEIAKGAEQHLVRCTFDNKGEAEHYACQISISKRDWEHISYENKGSGDYYFKTKHTIGIVDIKTAEQIANLAKNFTFSLFQNVKDFNCDYSRDYSLTTPEFKKGMEELFVELNLPGKSIDGYGALSEVEYLEFGYVFSGSLNDAEVNREGLWVHLNGVPINRLQEEQVQLLLLIEQAISVGHDDACFPVKWNYTLPIIVRNGSVYWESK